MDKTKKDLILVLIIILAAVFAISAFMLLRYFAETHKAESDFKEMRNELLPTDSGPELSDDYEALLPAYRALEERNKDFIGWLRIYDTVVNYPVMQNVSSPEYYLHRNFSREYSGSGTLFASEISDIAKPSDVTIIYGHRMKNGSMFGAFNKFADKAYCDEHHYIRFDTLQERRSYEIVCVYRTTVDTGEESEYRYYDASDFASETAFNDYIRQARSKAYFDSGLIPSYGDELIVLSTCEYSEENGRLIVVGRRIPNDKAPEFPSPED